MTKMMQDRLPQLLKLLETEPNDAELLYGIAMEHQKRDDHAAAIQCFDRAIAADEGMLYAYYHKARSQEEVGDRAAAQRTLAIGRERAASTGNEKAKAEMDQFLLALG